MRTIRKILRVVGCERIAALGVGLGFCLCAEIGSDSIAQAQVIPDASLPQPSIAVEQGDQISIQGGTPSGTNLFHSFEEFSIPESSEVLFEAIPIETQNVLTRVTGDQISIINGQLRSNHPASFFLINPNGIQFGETAQLALGGSFIATSAEQIEFADGFVWSITDVTPDGLLALDIPIGLQAGRSPGTVINQSQAASQLFPPDRTASITDIPLDIAFNPYRSPNVGLEVLPGRSLALVGGDVLVNDGNLTAPSGQIYLASLDDQAAVRWQPLDQSFAFDFDLSNNFGLIELRGTSALDVSGLGGGEIRLLGDQLNLQDRSTLSALTFGDQDSRGIELAARSRVAIGGDVGIVTVTLGTGASGDMTIRAGEAIELVGLGAENLFQLQLAQLSIDARTLTDPNTSTLGTFRVTGLNAASLGTGRAGNVTMTTANLQARDGAIVLTAAGASGPGGNIDLQVADTIAISGSLFQASSLLGSTGNAGNINVQASNLQLTENGSLASAALGTGRGGDVNVQLRDRFSINNALATQGIPAGLFVNSLLETGDAGSINLRARTIEVNDVGYISSQSGVEIPGLGLFDRAGAGGDIMIVATESITLANSLPNTISAGSITPNPAGSVSITTPQLTLQNGSGISVANLGIGDAGAIEIQADRLVLSDGASLSASTRTGRSGGISLQTNDLRLDSSSITTNAGSSNGGNIAIVTDTLTALNNSDITANTGAGTGGRVTLNVRGLFGISVRDRLTSMSDITASSSLGTEFRGVIDIVEPDLDTTTGLTSLPSEFVNIAAINRNTCGWTAGSTFYVTGSSAVTLPPDIVTPLRYGIRNQLSPSAVPMARSQQTTSEWMMPITEADHWGQDSQGNPILQSGSPLLSFLDCTPKTIPVRMLRTSSSKPTTAP